MKQSGTGRDFGPRLAGRLVKLSRCVYGINLVRFAQVKTAPGAVFFCLKQSLIFLQRL